VPGLAFTVRVEGDIVADLAAIGKSFKPLADAALRQTAAALKQQGRAAVAAALSARAANTLRMVEYPDPDRPVAEWFYSNWQSRQRDVLAGFAFGAVVTPREAGALAVPMTSEAQGSGMPFAQGQVPTAFNVPGGVMAGSNGWSGRRRTTPGIFETMTGLRLEQVDVRGRAYLVVHVRRPDQGGIVDNRLTGKRLRGKFGLNLNSLGRQKAAATFTVFVFALLRRTNVPQRIAWEPVVQSASAMLTSNLDLAFAKLGVSGEGVAEWGLPN
jgi:hypothetical protein